jgi:hypothetical protein
MPTHPFSLAQLGWRPFHSQQLRLEDLDAAYPARVASVHRSGLVVHSERGTAPISLPTRVLSRLERYLAISFEAKVEPVIVLTKVDLCDEAEQFTDQARTLSRDIAVVPVNSLQASSASSLGAWLQAG